MTLQIKGVLPATQDYSRMYKVWKTCTDNDVTPPDAVWEFFGDQAPNPGGMEIVIPFAVDISEDAAAVHYDIDLQRIPGSVRTIRISLPVAAEEDGEV